MKQYIIRVRFGWYRVLRVPDEFGRDEIAPHSFVLFVNNRMHRFGTRRQATIVVTGRMPFVLHNSSNFDPTAARTAPGAKEWDRWAFVGHRPK